MCDIKVVLTNREKDNLKMRPDVDEFLSIILKVFNAITYIVGLENPTFVIL